MTAPTRRRSVLVGGGLAQAEQIRAVRPRLVRALLCALVLVPAAITVAVFYSFTVTVPELILDPSSSGGTGSIGLSTVGAIIAGLVGLVVGFTAALVTAGVLGLAIRFRWPEWASVSIVLVAVFVISCGILGAGGSSTPGLGQVVFSAIAALGAAGASAIALVPRMRPF